MRCLIHSTLHSMGNRERRWKYKQDMYTHYEQTGNNHTTLQHSQHGLLTSQARYLSTLLFCSSHTFSLNTASSIPSTTSLIRPSVSQSVFPVITLSPIIAHVVLNSRRCQSRLHDGRSHVPRDLGVTLSS